MSYQHSLWRPFWDAAFQRGAGHAKLHKHAWGFPNAQAQAREDQTAAVGLGYPCDEHWLLRHTLSQALDRRDDWMCALGRSQTLSEEVTVKGQWPTSPFIALGTHWGAGMPTLAHLALADLKPVFVYRQEPASVFATQAMRFAHRLHLKAIDALGGAITLGGAYNQIMEALGRQATPVILMDAPAHGRPTIEGRWGHFRLHVRLGLLEMLCREKIPYAFYRCGFEPKTYQRQLAIGSVHTATDPQAIADLAAQHLGEALAMDASQWRLWMVASSLIEHTSV